LCDYFSVQFNFPNHLRRLYAMANVILIDTDIVAVSEVEFLRNVSLIIDKQSPRTVQNYMIWHFMMNQVDYLPERFRDIKQKFLQVFKGIAFEPTRAIACANYVNANMGLAVSKLYIAKYFDKNARNQVHNE
jgi:predicted metalloendopeptidase